MRNRKLEDRFKKCYYCYNWSFTFNYRFQFCKMIILCICLLISVVSASYTSQCVSLSAIQKYDKVRGPLQDIEKYLKTCRGSYSSKEPIVSMRRTIKKLEKKFADVNKEYYGKWLHKLFLISEYNHITLNLYYMIQASIWKGNLFVLFMNYNSYIRQDHCFYKCFVVFKCFSIYSCTDLCLRLYILI